jgi:hypothetical protein
MVARRIPPVVIACALAVGAIAMVSAQPRTDRNRSLTADQRRESVDLVRIVDSVAGGELPGGDAWLSLDAHFLRAPDGRTYVPFTLKVQEAPEGFETIGLYVRVMRAEAPSESARVDIPTGTNAGDFPASVPERQFVRPGTPTAGENAAVLAATSAYLQRSPQRFPFEDLHFGALGPAGREIDLRLIRRAMVVPAGEYDLFVAIRESGGRKSSESRTRAAVLKQRLVVPDFSKPDLQMSSILLADRIEPLARPLSQTEQAERPFALGSVEIEPARDTVLQPSESLSVIFFVYNPATNASGTPDLKVDYQFYRTGAVETLFIATQPQVFEKDPLPPGRNRVQVVDAAIPMARFAPGTYRLSIHVTDRLADTALARDLYFTVGASD